MAKRGSGVLPFERKRPTTTVFEPTREFSDEIHGQVLLNTVERDLIDTPEFQRLFRVSQLGLVDLVYQTGNHTRGAHSIGTCHVAGRLIARLRQNNHRLSAFANAPANIPSIDKAEEVLIRLGALLHDLSHGPLSHDIEKKTHYIFPRAKDRDKRIKIASFHGPYKKHDDWKENPALYVTLFRTRDSILARVLRAYSPAFWTLLTEESSHADFVAAARQAWPDVEHDVLAALLFHLLAYEKIEDAIPFAPLDLRTSFADEKTTSWGLGPEAATPDVRRQLHMLWYQPYRHDIIGDTLSADLIDYIARDTKHLAMTGGLDENLLRFYVLARTFHNEQGQKLDDSISPLYRCAIELWDYKRGTIRSERINDVFRLLDLRHEIHEKAVFHRVVQSGIAMVARSIQLLPTKPPVKDLYNLGTPETALAGDDHFFRLLQDSLPDKNDLSAIPTKLIERRIYRPLIIIPGDRVAELLHPSDFPTDQPEYGLRELAAITDSCAFADFTFAVSYLIEQLLEHCAASETEEGPERKIYTVEGLVRRAVESRAYRDKIRSKRPQRVIIWTIPYKQLYKDPSLLVAAKHEAHSIERLARLDDVPPIFDGLHKRIKAGVVDSEQKYESLWKLYVFLSDGLFFSGPHAKLLPDIPCRDDATRHEEHLREATHIVARALRAMWQYWSVKRDEITDDTTLHDWLENPMPDDDFQNLLTLLRSEWELKAVYHAEESAARASLVDVRQYLHGAYIEGEPSNCRDARYKHSLAQKLATTHPLFDCLITTDVHFPKLKYFASPPCFPSVTRSCSRQQRCAPRSGMVAREQRRTPPSTSTLSGSTA